MTNNKGFTLVELLAVFAVLSILMGVAIQAYSRYKEKAVNQSYATMSANSANAAEEYFMDHMASNEVEISKLVANNYLSEVVDPRDSSAKCDGKVTKIQSKIEKGNGKSVDYIPLKVELSCIRYDSCMVYPEVRKCGPGD